jgi:hypothetical protein
VDLESVQLGSDPQFMGNILPLLSFRLLGNLGFAVLCIALIRAWARLRLPPFTPLQWSAGRVA